jgi:chromate transporter
MSIVLDSLDWLHLFGHFLSLSLLAVGGAIATAPDMHRYLVEQQHWLTQSQFSASMALAQAAPGPNLLFIPLLGWNVGINSAGGTASGMAAWPWGLLGVALSMVGMLLPSTTLTLAAARWGHQNRERLGVRAFKTGMAPIVIGLLGATGWILANAQGSLRDNLPMLMLTAMVTLLVWRTRIHLLWLLAAGGMLGWAGLI